MHDEDDFLRKLLDNPAADTVRLVYADWLDERADAESKLMAQFLRLTVQLLEPGLTPGWQKKLRRKELQPLAAKLPTEWLAVVSRLKVEGCPTKAAEARPNRLGMVFVHQLFEFVCDK